MTRATTPPAPPTTPPVPKDLLRVAQMAAERWQAGRLEYGGSTWQGRHPIVEALEEALDLVVYLMVLRTESDLMRRSTGLAGLQSYAMALVGSLQTWVDGLAAYGVDLSGWPHSLEPMDLVTQTLLRAPSPDASDPLVDSE